MTRLATASFLLLSTLPVAACTFVHGNGEETTEQRSVSDFEAIEAAWEGDVRVQVDASAQSPFTLELSGDANILPYVETEVRGDTLVVDVRKGIEVQPVQPLVLETTVVRLNEAAVSGSGDLEVSGVDAPSFEATVSGSGNLEADLRAEKITLGISGSGQIHVQGDGEEVEADVTGSGKLDARDFTARSGSVTVAGSGDVHLCVDGTLAVSISGSGDVYSYCGADIEATITGSGEVHEE